jgi:hypothetical protein
MEQLNWVPRLKYTQAETGTHAYRVTTGTIDGAWLLMWRFDAEAPNGRKLIHTRRHPTIEEAQRSAEIIAEHAAK